MSPRYKLRHFSKSHSLKVFQSRCRERDRFLLFLSFPPSPSWIFYYVISGVSGVLTCKSASGVRSVWRNRNNRYRPKSHSVFLKMCHRIPRKSTLEYLFWSVNSKEVEEFEMLEPKSGKWAGITLEDDRFLSCSNPRFLVMFVNLQSKFQLLKSLNLWYYTKKSNFNNNRGPAPF